jgi:hypothetical protein
MSEEKTTALQMRILKLEAEIDRLKKEIKALLVIQCPDGIFHRWDSEGMCKECGNYATDLIDAAMGKRE